MDYLFVFEPNNHSWWLKVSDMDQLMDYIKLTQSSRYEGALNLYFDIFKKGANSDEDGTDRSVMEILDSLPNDVRFNIFINNHNDYNLMVSAIMKAEQYEVSILEGFRLLNMEFGMKMMKNIQEYGQIYINRVGGNTHDLNYTQSCRQSKMVWPDFTEKDIRIKRFPYGSHYYAYVGNVEVKDGNKKKWNTYEEAFRIVSSIVGQG